MQRELKEQRSRRARPRPDPVPSEVVAPGSIVVGVDGSTGSTDALRWALGEARRLRLEVDAILAWRDVLSAGPPTPLSALTTAQRRRLEDRVATVLRAASRGGGIADLSVRTHVFSAEPVETLATLAPRAAMVVVGSRGYGTLRGALLGSVSRRCAMSAPGVTVVVRGTWDSRGPDEPRRVVVGLDGSTTADSAMTWAATVGTDPGDYLSLNYAWGSNGVGMETGEVVHRLTRTGKEMLEEAARGLVDSGRTVTTQLDYGPAETMLLGSSEDADLLVVGSRGRGSLSSLLLGSVSLHCVSRAHCPVAVVRPAVAG